MTSWLSSHMFMDNKAKENEADDDASSAPKTDVETTVPPAPEESQISEVAQGPQPEVSTDTSYDKRDIVAEWRVPLKGKLHKVEFEHGTTSGKRVLWVDEKVLLLSTLIRTTNY